MRSRRPAEVVAGQVFAGTEDLGCTEITVADDQVVRLDLDRLEGFVDTCLNLTPLLLR